MTTLTKYPKICIIVSIRRFIISLLPQLLPTPVDPLEVEEMFAFADKGDSSSINILMIMVMIMVVMMMMMMIKMTMLELSPTRTGTGGSPGRSSRS